MLFKMNYKSETNMSISAMSVVSMAFSGEGYLDISESEGYLD